LSDNEMGTLKKKKFLLFAQRLGGII
jgi:hypothetical protein